MTQKSSKRRAALLVDNLRLCRWQSAALEAAGDVVEIVMVLNCQNTKAKRNVPKHLLYYILNFWSLKTPLTRKKAERFPNCQVINFSADQTGDWQSLPDSVWRSLNATISMLLSSLVWGFYTNVKRFHCPLYFLIIMATRPSTEGAQPDFTRSFLAKELRESLFRP